jgi:tetratricopeptide (TPR) repeat protein
MLSLRTACLIALLLAPPAAAAETAEAVAANEAGIRQLLEGRPAEAVVAFEKAHERAPESVVVRRNLAAALAALGEEKRKAHDPHGAVELFDRAVTLHPERLRYRVLRGLARVETGVEGLRYYAREDFAYVLDRDPDHLDALFNLGEVAYMDRQLEEAVALWRRARALRPSDASIQSRLDKAERELAVERSYEQLRGRVFLIRYAPEIDATQATTVLRLCEEAYGLLTKQFSVYPDKIVVTLYTPSQFASATRMHGWVAGLSDGTIRLTVRGNAGAKELEATVYHELTHHLVRRIAPRAPVWLHEGLAQRAEGRSVEAAEERLRRGEPLPNAGELSAEILRERDPRRVGRFYDLTLAFTTYLQQQYHDAGITKLLERLGERVPEDKAIRDVFGASRAQLFAAWLERLQAR